MRWVIILLLGLCLTCAEEVDSHASLESYIFQTDMAPFDGEFEKATAWWNARALAGAPALGISLEGKSLVLFARLGFGEVARTWSFRGSFYVYFDEAYPWTPGAFCWAARHELGHVLGFAHSSDPSDVMYPVLGGRSCY